MRFYANKMMTEEEIGTYRESKKLIMRRLRANPVSNERMKARIRKWYKESGRAERQKQYLAKFKECDFFRWRTRLFNFHYETKFKPIDFQRLWEKQNGLCYLTGQSLDKTAQIDHIIPIRKGGNNELSNLRWVTKEANLAKRNLTDAEFLKLCANVIEFLGSLLSEALVEEAFLHA